MWWLLFVQLLCLPFSMWLWDFFFVFFLNPLENKSYTSIRTEALSVIQLLLTKLQGETSACHLGEPLMGEEGTWLCGQEPWRDGITSACSTGCFGAVET